jgi:hypothetical protein
MIIDYSASDDVLRFGLANGISEDLVREEVRPDVNIIYDRDGGPAVGVEIKNASQHGDLGTLANHGLSDLDIKVQL